MFESTSTDQKGNPPSGEGGAGGLSPDQELFPIRTVSSITGVNSVTLRAWERRYGLIRPKRTAKGHRLYSREDIHRINQVLGLLERGISIGQVRAALDSHPAELPERAGPWADYVARMVDATIRFDEKALTAIYNDALALYPVEFVTEQLIVPLLKELGRRWESAEGSVAEEHFFSVYMRNKLGARFHHMSSESRGPKLLCACVPYEQHEIALMLFCLAAMARNYRVVLLGAQMPFEDLPLAAKRSNCDAVVLAGSEAAYWPGLEADLRVLVKESPAPVMIGGALSTNHRDEISRAGAAALGEDVAQGIRRIGEVLAVN